MRRYDVTVYTGNQDSLTVAEQIKGLRHVEVTDVMLSAGKAYKVVAVSQEPAVRYEQPCTHVITLLSRRAMRDQGRTVPVVTEWVPVVEEAA